MLKIENLQVSAQDKKILENLNLEVKAGETHIIMGKNGTGKSTLCKALLNDPALNIKGKVTFNDEEIIKMPTNEIAKRGIFLLEQNPTEIPGVTNAEMLRLSLQERGKKESIFEFNKKINEACEKLSIDKSYIHKNINERMSGGEKKKNELLGIYILKPSLILLDELDSGLDIDSLKSLSLGLLEYQKETNAAIIVITHHTNILKYLHPDKVHILENGKFTIEGDKTLAEKIENQGFTGSFNINGDGEHE